MKNYSNGIVIHSSFDAFIKAVHCGNNCEVQRYIKSEFVNRKCWEDDGVYQKPMHYAAVSGRLEILQTLVNNGAQIDCTDWIRRKPIHYAAYGGSLAAIQWLNDQGADLNCEDDVHCQPIHYAAYRGSKEIVQWLLDRGSDASVIDDAQRTPMHHAAEGGSVDVMQLLLERKADPDAEDKVGCRPIHYAVQGSHRSVIKWLFAQGTNVEATDFNKRRPLHIACQIGQEEVVRWLVSEAGCVLDAFDDYGRSPASIAEQYGNCNCIKILKETEISRKSNEFVIVHLPSFSLACRNYSIFDFGDAFKKIQQNGVSILQPLIICHLPNFRDYLLPNNVAIPINWDILNYKEYIVVPANDKIDTIATKLLKLREWSVQISPITEECKRQINSYEGLQIDNCDNMADWTCCTALTLDIHNSGEKYVAGQLRMFVSHDNNVGEIKDAFVGYFMFLGYGEMRLLAATKKYTKESIESSLKKLVHAKRQLLIFYDSNRQKMANSTVIKYCRIAVDGRMVVLQKMTTEVQLVPPLSQLYTDSNNLWEKLVTERPIVLKRIIDDEMILVVSRKECATSGDMSELVFKHVNEPGRLMLISNYQMLNNDVNIEEVEDVIYYSIVRPFKNITLVDDNDRGRFGIVFLCKVEDTNDEMAIKKMRIDPKYGIDLKRDVRGEIFVAARAGPHDRLIRYLQFYQTDSHFYILMDRMKESVSTHLRKHHPLEESKIIHFAKDILEGLAYLHDHKIVHRNIKGANILLDENDSAKLTDFGVCKCITVDTSIAGSDGGTTQTGTFNWMAPEIICGFNHGLKSDVWSFGATMVEIMTGKPPFPELVPTAVVIHLYLTRSLDYEFPCRLTMALKPFVNSCLRSEIEDRPSCDLLLSHPIFTGY